LAIVRSRNDSVDVLHVILETAAPLTATCVGLGCDLYPETGVAGKPVPGSDGQLLCRYLRAGYAASRYCFWRRLSVRTISRKLLVGNRCNLVGICPMVNARSDWKLVTFDLDL